jgi:hypothetical protein
VRVPEQAQSGTATVTVWFPGWTGVEFAQTSFTAPVAEQSGTPADPAAR